MEREWQPRKKGRARTRVLRRLAPACGVLVVLLGALTLAGWFLSLRGLTNLGQPSIAMAPNTGLAFVLLGALVIPAPEQIRSRWLRWPARIIAGLVLAIVMMRLMEIWPFIGWSTDRWLFDFPDEVADGIPLGRMAIQSASTLALAR